MTCAPPFQPLRTVGDLTGRFPQISIPTCLVHVELLIRKPCSTSTTADVTGCAPLHRAHPALPDVALWASCVANSAVRIGRQVLDAAMPDFAVDASSKLSALTSPPAAGSFLYQEVHVRDMQSNVVHRFHQQIQDAVAAAEASVDSKTKLTLQMRLHPGDVGALGLRPLDERFPALQEIPAPLTVSFAYVLDGVASPDGDDWGEPGPCLLGLRWEPREMLASAALGERAPDADDWMRDEPSTADDAAAFVARERAQENAHLDEEEEYERELLVQTKHLRARAWRRFCRISRSEHMFHQRIAGGPTHAKGRATDGDESARSSDSGSTSEPPQPESGWSRITERQSLSHRRPSGDAAFAIEPYFVGFTLDFPGASAKDIDSVCRTGHHSAEDALSVFFSNQARESLATALSLTLPQDEWDVGVVPFSRVSCRAAVARPAIERYLATSIDKNKLPWHVSKCESAAGRYIAHTQHVTVLVFLCPKNVLPAKQPPSITIPSHIVLGSFMLRTCVLPLGGLTVAESRRRRFGLAPPNTVAHQMQLLQWSMLREVYFAMTVDELIADTMLCLTAPVQIRGEAEFHRLLSAAIADEEQSVKLDYDGETDLATALLRQQEQCRRRYRERVLLARHYGLTQESVRKVLDALQLVLRGKPIAGNRKLWPALAVLLRTDIVCCQEPPAPSAEAEAIREPVGRKPILCQRSPAAAWRPGVPEVVTDERHVSASDSDSRRSSRSASRSSSSSSSSTSSRSSRSSSTSSSSSRSSSTSSSGSRRSRRRVGRRRPRRSPSRRRAVYDEEPMQPIDATTSSFPDFLAWRQYQFSQSRDGRRPPPGFMALRLPGSVQCELVNVMTACRGGVNRHAAGTTILPMLRFIVSLCCIGTPPKLPPR